jgi:hypothetical protein
VVFRIEAEVSGCRSQHSCELEGLTRTLRYVANILQHPLDEFEIRARTKEIRRARITVVPLKVYLAEKPTIAMAR